ncbi:uncharacterized protein LOC121803008 isoform X1 [Salvia splendens]|uniref:uncharacterized protein LOC121803008 isoform X1 n=1 Tax=Salvia splendens TaxID=180675 RepID=UPI001C27B347|nr:uncharacterized protein LOC121803008 isoform X1 [Salvia splendens]
MNPNFISSSSSSNEDGENSHMIYTYNQFMQDMQRRIDNNMLIQYLRDHQSPQIYRGSVPGHIVINRDREGAHARLYNDYFADNPLYNETMFRRRFRMSRPLFLRIVDAVKEHDDYFVQRPDGTGRLGLSSLQKVTAVIRILAYGVPDDACDEYVKISESSAIKSLKRFCRAIIEVFSTQYLRSPTTNDIARPLYIGEQRGFPGILGSLDCMHWKWKNCPAGWSGSYSGRSGSPTIILEAVADYDLWIWHAYFGLPGSNNDINVLDFYYLTQGPLRYWDKEVLRDIMITCIILHNMIVEDERDLSSPIKVARHAPQPEVEMTTNEDVRFQEYLTRYAAIRNKNAHLELRNALVDHLWENFSNTQS